MSIYNQCVKYQLRGAQRTKAAYNDPFLEAEAYYTKGVAEDEDILIVPKSPSAKLNKPVFPTASFLWYYGIVVDI